MVDALTGEPLWRRGEEVDFNNRSSPYRVIGKRRSTPHSERLGHAVGLANLRERSSGVVNALVPSPVVAERNL